MRDTVSLKALRTRIRELEAQASLLEQCAKPGISELQAIVVKYRLTAADVALAVKATAAPPRHGVPQGTRLKPKYRNPANRSETWAGRGLKPRWVIEHLNRGRKLDDLAI